MIAFFLIVAIGFIFTKLYPWIHTTFYATLPEAEVQTYSMGIVVGVMVLSLWFWISHNIHYTPGVCKIHTRCVPALRITLTIFVGIVALLLFQQTLSQNQEMITFFQNMEVMPSSFTPVSYVIVTFILYLLFILFENRSLRLSWLWHALVLISIFLLTFHVGYLNPYDLSLYAGPINDSLQGKPPLSYPSTYGFFVIVFLSGIFSIIPLSLFHLHIVTAILTTLGFIAFYILANILLKNRGVAFLATILAISANWLTGIGYRGSFPQTGVLRFGMWYVVAFAVYVELKYRQRWTTILAVALSFFWSFDVGAYVVAAYLMFRWFVSLHASIQKTITGFVPHLMLTIGTIIGVFLLITLVSTISFGAPPQWNNFWGSTSAFLSGPLLLPLSSSIIPWLVLAPAIISICYVLSVIKKERSRLDTSDTLLLFTACYGITQFMYFVSRSHPNNLHHVILPSILCLFVLVHRLIKNSSSGVLAASLLLAYPMTLFAGQGIRNLKSENFLTTLQTLRSPKGTEQERFGAVARALEAQYGSFLASRDFGFLSLYDTWYLILLKTTNTIGTNALFTYLTPEAVVPIVENITSHPPTVLFVDKNPYDHLGEVSWVFNKISYLYQWKESVGPLDVYGVRR